MDEQVTVTVDTKKLDDLGLSMLQVSTAIGDNNISFAGGDIDQDGANFPIRATHEFGSLEDIRNLTVGFELPLVSAAPGVPTITDRRGDRAVLLRDVAKVKFDSAGSNSISRTNGKPSLSLAVLKDPDANTVDVTSSAMQALDDIEGLPSTSLTVIAPLS